MSANPVDKLRPVTMTERGDVVEVAIESFTAGAVPAKAHNKIIIIVEYDVLVGGASDGCHS